MPLFVQTSKAVSVLHQYLSGIYALFVFQCPNQARERTGWDQSTTRNVVCGCYCSNFCSVEKIIQKANENWEFGGKNTVAAFSALAGSPLFLPPHELAQILLWWRERVRCCGFQINLNRFFQSKINLLKVSPSDPQKEWDRDKMRQIEPLPPYWDTLTRG